MAFVPDIASALHQTLFSSGSGNPTSPVTRVPMKFTSTLRMRGGNQQGILPIIAMEVNPNSIDWDQPKRITKRDTQEGSIFFHFSNSRGENNDILVMNFGGNTGNIDLRGDIVSNTGLFSAGNAGTNTGASKKLLVWHNLWALTREQMLLSDNTINEFRILYSSPVITSEISLFGFFSNVLKFRESADKPNSLDYTFSFTVQRIFPDINQIMSDLQIGFGIPTSNSV